MANPVLVGIDGSDAGPAAAEWAATEAEARGLAVRLVNVWQLPASNVQFSPDPEGLRIWAAGRVEEIAEQVQSRHTGVPVSAEQVLGPPGRVLLDLAASSEMIVLGSHGPTGLSGLLYGSISLHVLAHCARPVVLVREPAEILEPSGDRTGRDVLVGLDIARPCDSLAAFAFEEAAARRTHLHAVHVLNQRTARDHAAPATPAGGDEELLAARGHELTKFLAPWHEKFADVELSEEIVRGPVAECLLEAGRGAGLLVMGRRRKRMPVGQHLGHVAHGVLHHVSGPVALVSHG